MIPEDVKNKIDERYPTSLKFSGFYKESAEFGYQLASEQLLEKDKTIEVLKKEVDVLISQRTIRDARINDLEAALRELVAQADPIDDRWNYMAAIEKAKSLLTK